MEIESSWWGQRGPGGDRGPQWEDWKVLPGRTKVWKDWKPQRSHRKSPVSALGLDLTGELKPGTTLRSSQPEGPPRGPVLTRPSTQACSPPTHQELPCAADRPVRLPPGQGPAGSRPSAGRLEARLAHHPSAPLVQGLLGDARSVDAHAEKFQPAEPLSVSPQGERGPPGVNGTQGFQGCPGQRGVKVECGCPSVWGGHPCSPTHVQKETAPPSASWRRRMLAWLLRLALGSQWPLTEGAPGLAGSGAQAALGREPEVGETSCLWQCEATSRH